MRRWARLVREEYALSAATAAGRVRGRPMGTRILMRARTAVKRGALAACPGGRT